MDSDEPKIEPSDSTEPDAADTTDYNKLYEDLQAQFHESYALSQKLFLTERAQRQTLYHYKRRVDALLDYIGDLEGRDPDFQQPMVEENQLIDIINKKPHLKDTLAPLLEIITGPAPREVPLKQRYNVDLATEEMIPDIINDELDSAELNPQDTEMWVRRNYSYLVVSKFRPLDIRGKGVREYVDLPLLKKKRKVN